MSRISRARVEPGDLVSATDLNNRYADFTQPGAINQYNARDHAFDLPQMANSGLILLNSVDGDVGTGDLYHSAPNTVPSTTVAPATPTLITGAVGNVVVTSAGGWATTTGDIIRVYFNLQARSLYTGSPMYSAGPPAALGLYNVLGGAGNIADGNHVWLLQLEWDITSAALANFVPVSGQSQAQGIFTGGLYGMKLSDLAGTCCIPAWHSSADEWVNSTLAAGATKRYTRKLWWQGASGTWHFQSTGQKIYGFRLRAHGLYHPYQNAGGDNGFVLDVAVGGVTQYLEYDGGHIVAMHMREQ